MPRTKQIDLKTLASDIQSAATMYSASEVNLYKAQEYQRAAKAKLDELTQRLAQRSKPRSTKKRDNAEGQG